MGFFNAIEQLAQINPPIMPAEYLQKSQIFPTETRNEASNGSKKKPIHQENDKDEQRKRRVPQRKPQRLAFLHPCPICDGRSFTAGPGGGFFCTTCQPGIEGFPVEATGEGTRSTTVDPELIPVNYSPSGRPSTDRLPEQVTNQQWQCFRAAWPWIKENKAQLIGAGWNMAALVARSKYRWPYGRWGLAWLPIWTRDQLQITIDNRGDIIFLFHSCGKTIVQTANLQPSFFINNYS